MRFQPVEQPAERHLANIERLGEFRLHRRLTVAPASLASTQHCERVIQSGFSAWSITVRRRRETSWTRKPRLNWLG